MNLNDDFGRLFDGMLKERVDRIAAEPDDLVALVEAITLYHMVIEGVLALTGQHFIISYNEEQGRCRPSSRVLQRRPRRAPPRRLRCQVPHRHGRRRREVPGGDPADADRIPAGRRGRPAPPFAPEDDDEDFELFGVSMAETQAFAAQCLTRRLKVIGLAA